MEQITRNTWVRDTLIKVDVLNQLPESRRQQITTLYNQFKAINYIDARTEIGPSQYARMSAAQRDKITTNACKVFQIEMEIKLLLRTDEQILADEKALKEKEFRMNKERIENRKRQLEQYCATKLNSKRDNIVKREYEQLKAELQALTTPA